MRFFDIQILMEAEARIQHAEDIMFYEGSKGAMRVIQALIGLEKQGHKATTVKWDGKPAVIFGRNTNGDFVLTDKSGFSAKGYDGKPTSADDLENMLGQRSGGEARNRPDFPEYSGKMRDLFNQLSLSVPENHRGYFKGDLLYFETPPLKDGKFIFTPNIVTYAVDAESDLGKRVQLSNAGLVLHREMDEEGNETALKNSDILTGSHVLFVPPISVEKPATKISPVLNKLQNIVKQNSASIDLLLNEQQLTKLKLKNLPALFYAYVNSKVDTGLDGIGADFISWLESTDRVSDVKKTRIKQYILDHKEGYSALWKVFNSIMMVKNKIIAQFDNHGGAVQQRMNTIDEPGGEGYVLADPDGDIKLVPRATFSKANRMANA